MGYVAGIEQWARLAVIGAACALDGMGRMIGHDVRLTAFEVERVCEVEIAGRLGEPGAPVVSMHLAIGGAAGGEVVMVFGQEAAHGMTDLVIGQAPGTTAALGDLERSALSELGKIVAGMFLNALADESQSVLLPTTPRLAIDCVGDVAQRVRAASEARGARLLLTRATFEVTGSALKGELFVAPGADLLELLDRQAARAA